MPAFLGAAGAASTPAGMDASSLVTSPLQAAVASLDEDTSPTERGSVSVTDAAPQENAAVIHRASTSSIKPISKAATAGPTMFTEAPSDWLAPTNRWRSAPSRSQTDGSRASRADMPGAPL